VTDRCPTCGAAVKVVGKTTLHYEPVVALDLSFGTVEVNRAFLLALADELDALLEKAVKLKRTE